LDEETDNPKSVARHVVEVAAGDYSAEIPRCMGMPQVWIMGADVDGQERRKALLYRTLAWLRTAYSEPWSDVTQGAPTYFSFNVIGLEGDQFDYDSADELDGLYDVADVHSYDEDEADGHFIYNGLLWMPPADSTLTMNVFGHFYQKKLVLDTDINYWTVRKPLTLVKAACMMHESSLRNKQGYADWKAMVDDDLLGVDKSVADMESANINQMEG